MLRIGEPTLEYCHRDGRESPRAPRARPRTGPAGRLDLDHAHDLDGQPGAPIPGPGYRKHAPTIRPAGSPRPRHARRSERRCAHRTRTYPPPATRPAAASTRPGTRHAAPGRLDHAHRADLDRPPEPLRTPLSTASPGHAPHRASTRQRPPWRPAGPSRADAPGHRVTLDGQRADLDGHRARPRQAPAHRAMPDMAPPARGQHVTHTASINRAPRHRRPGTPHAHSYINRAHTRTGHYR